VYDRRLLSRILGEFREMPGLSLTATQAARLLGIDLVECMTALQELVTAGLLRQTDDGHYALPGGEGSANGWHARRHSLR
jgi:DNA-binding IclR family transcriptional regulator